MEEDKILTLEEAAEFLKIPKQTMYKLAQEGRVPGKKVGRHWRFHVDMLEKWIKGEER